MNFLYSDEPIIACSTGNQSHAAISVLRISGITKLVSLQKFFKKSLEFIEPRKAYFTQLLDEDTVLDDIVFTFFQGPNSYNGENILELCVHGNLLNIERILKLFIAKAGFRLAAPGEFTYRALKNRKLTLSQVEGLDLFLNANSGYALDQGLSLLSGGLHELYLDLYDLFLKHKASLELSIDFSEDVGEETARHHYLDSLEQFSKKFMTLVKRVEPLGSNILQPEIILAGLPNSGKSSLFNLLLADERAIVSPLPGTTRDFLSEELIIEDVKYKLVDTAGLRSSLDQIEVEGIRRTRKKLSQGFFTVLLINPLEVGDEIEELLQESFDFIVFTHADLPGFAEAQELLKVRFPQLGSIGAINLHELPDHWEGELKTSINKKYLSLTQNKPILLDRHKYLIMEIHSQMKNYEKTVSYEHDVAILSSELNTLGHCLSELLGIISPDQVLNSIFSNFCIGK